MAKNKQNIRDTFLAAICAGSALLFGIAGVAGKNITYLFLAAFFVVLAVAGRPKKQK